MPKLSKKTTRAIELVSVYDAVLREHFESSLSGYFADDRPEMWNDDEKQAFDIATEVEYRTKSAILDLLGVKVESVEGGEK